MTIATYACRFVVFARCSLWVLAVSLLCAGVGRARAMTADISIHTPGLQLGALALRDVTVTVHTTTKGMRTCITAALERARIRGCGWLGERNGQVVLRGGRVTVTVPHRQTDGLELGRTTLTTTVSGNLSTLDLHLEGSARTALVRLDSPLAHATLDDLSLPFSVRIHRVDGALRITEAAPLTVRVRSASLASAGATLDVKPVITLHPGWPQWRVDVGWTGVALGPALFAASKGRITGTGSLSGELAFRGNKSDVRLVRGIALAQRGGELRVTDPVLRASLVASLRDRLAIQQRIAATLSDFAYSNLALTFGADPLIKISIRGRGKRVAQDLDLAVNVRTPPT